MSWLEPITRKKLTRSILFLPQRHYLVRRYPVQGIARLQDARLTNVASFVASAPRFIGLPSSPQSNKKTLDESVGMVRRFRRREPVSSPHPVDERYALLEAPQIIEEVSDQPDGLIDVPAASVRSDITVWRRPEGMFRGKRFRIGYIQVSRRQPGGSQRLDQRALIRGSSPSDLRSDGLGRQLQNVSLVPVDTVLNVKSFEDSSQAGIVGLLVAKNAENNVEEFAHDRATDGQGV